MLSTIRAGASCLPIVGPFVGFANIIILNDERRFSNLPTQAQLKLAGMAFQGVGEVFNAVNQGKSELNPEFLAQVDKAQEEADSERDEKLRNEEPIALAKEGRVYSICGITGNISTAVLLVGLIAFGILNTGFLPISVIPAIIFTAKHLHNLTIFNKEIIEFRSRPDVLALSRV